MKIISRIEATNIALKLGAASNDRMWGEQAFGWLTDYLNYSTLMEAENATLRQRVAELEAGNETVHREHENAHVDLQFYKERAAKLEAALREIASLPIATIGDNVLSITTPFPQDIARAVLGEDAESVDGQWVFARTVSGITLPTQPINYKSTMTLGEITYEITRHGITKDGEPVAAEAYGSLISELVESYQQAWRESGGGAE